MPKFGGCGNSGGAIIIAIIVIIIIILIVCMICYGVNANNNAKCDNFALPLVNGKPCCSYPSCNNCAGCTNCEDVLNDMQQANF